MLNVSRFAEKLSLEFKMSLLEVQIGDLEIQIKGLPIDDPEKGGFEYSLGKLQAELKVAKSQHESLNVQVPTR